MIIYLSVVDCDLTMRYGPQLQKTCLQGFANNKGADQPAHMRSLISAFVRLTESIISRHSTSEISMFKLVSVAEQANLNITLLETPKTGFVAIFYLGLYCLPK